MKKKVLFLVWILFVFCDVAIAKVVNNDYYDYQLIVSDSCSVEYFKKDSSIVAITSPDGMSTFYISCINTGDYEKTYTNDLLKTFDSEMFNTLKKEPDKIETYFWFSKEDHFFSLENGVTCKTRTMLWNNKAGLLVGFTKNGNMDFIENCMNDFKSPITLGKIATVVYILIFSVLLIIGFYLWVELRFLAIIYFILFAIAWYYFHWVMDYSVNHFILSFLG